MRYVEYLLVDRGFFVTALGGVGEVWGLDNRVTDEEGFEDDQTFRHLGVDGYPDGRLFSVDRPGQAKTKCLAFFADDAEPPQGGTEILAADVVALLVAEYGWPVGTTMVDGMPVAPERTL